MVKKKQKKGVLDELRRAVQAARATEIGRRYGDPGDVRTMRLAQRIHPHLMAVLDQRSREYGITRSQFIERVLIDYLNQNEHSQLDAIGRWVVNAEWNPRMARRLDQLPTSSKDIEIGKQVEREWREAQENEEIDLRALGIESPEDLQKVLKEMRPRRDSSGHLLPPGRAPRKRK